ncbi:hypothetical protein, partial [Streptomyces sp. MBT58]|uniref:hypothetical protein n=1 Tax=Streptomyces sp. MBT58 TaxID=1488389 RepID=UPI0035ABCF59
VPRTGGTRGGREGLRHHGLAARAGRAVRRRQVPLPLEGVDGTPGVLAGLAVGPPQLMNDEEEKYETEGDDELGGDPETASEQVPHTTATPHGPHD